MKHSNMTMSLKNNSKKAAALFLSSILLSSTLVPVSTASAHDLRHGKHYKKHHHSHVVRHKPKKRHVKRSKKRSNSNDKLVAGIVGFAIGAIIAGEAAKSRNVTYVQPQPVYPNPVYFEPNYNQPTNLAPAYVERRSLNNIYDNSTYVAPIAPQNNVSDNPTVIRYEDEVASASYEPWSQEWFSYCKAKFRSFNPATGTYLGYDGLNHFCVVK